MKNSFAILTLLFLCFSCSEKQEKAAPVIELKPTNTITQLDTLFFTNVSIFSDEDRNYVISQNPVFLAATDKDFNLLWSHRKEGNGPEELSFPEQGKVLEGKIFVLDQGNQSIKQFDSKTGEFISSIKINERFMKFRFDMTANGDSYLSYYSPMENVSALKISSNGETSGRFGSEFPVRFGPNRQMKYMQLDDHGNIILVGASLPYIEILNQEGKSINRFDIEKYEPIKRALDSLEVDIVKGERINQNSIPMIIKDAQYSEGKLYMSFTDRIGEDRTKARNLLVFRINEKECELESIFKFQTATDDDNLHPTYFYVDKHTQKLYVQGLVSKQIYVFELPE
jgi:DNA-binding beta-propeller fold protein YncE